MITTIGIIGSGTMGSGIAEVGAVAGFNVKLNDVSQSALDSAMKRIRQNLDRGVEKKRMAAHDAAHAFARIKASSNFDDLAPSTFVVEAALEDMSVKREIFQKLDSLLSPETILATNTSSLSVTAIAELVNRPEKVVGMHFFNPPPLMKLVEVVKGKQTSPHTLDLTLDIARRMRKTPVVCNDTPGFIVNRVARPFYLEALRLLGEGVATVEQIDSIVKLGGGFKMGPFELMDLIGIDVNYAVTKSVYAQFSEAPRFEPHPIQQQMVEAGTLGRKTKKGFYSYDK
ncbi:MAG: 3-hydroxyacyl-CoA dehydrogenase NAD-binding domain-containing protein [bacterium]